MGQVQIKPSSLEMQVPPLRQGSAVHGSKSAMQHKHHHWLRHVLKESAVLNKKNGIPTGIDKRRGEINIKLAFQYAFKEYLLCGN